MSGERQESERGRRCRVCKLGVQRTSSGLVCVNGHGGADEEGEPLGPDYQPFDRAAQYTASVRVSTTLNTLDPSVEAYDFETTPLIGPVAVVSRQFEKVYKDDNGYPIGKTQVFISYPCYREEVEKVVEVIGRFGQNVLRSEQKKNAERKQSSDSSSGNGEERPSIPRGNRRGL